MGELRAGIDLGGTKIEIVVLSDGIELGRERVATPQAGYKSILAAVSELFAAVKHQLSIEPQQLMRLGVGMPGAITDTGLVKNSNTVCLNGQPFQEDLQAILGQDVSIMNDANCFALSEAIDGVGAAANVVFAVILGTGVGGGIVADKKLWPGCNGIAGEWGHNPISTLAPRSSDKSRPCYCGRVNCIETFLCGAGLVQTHQELHGEALSAEAIAMRAESADAGCCETLALYAEQLAACLASVINVLDPEVIVLGGGVSNIVGLADSAERYLPRYVFSETIKTRVLINLHGDSSGVRGAAWL